MTWTRGAAAVATLTFDVDAETPVLAEGGRYAAHPMVMSHQSYGPDVGVPRILELLDEMAVPATFFVPGWVAEQRPGLAASIVERGHEVAHHSYSHRAPTSLPAGAERADFVRALEVFAAQGIPISGHRAAMWSASEETLSLVAEYGLTYDSSLMGDDRPYLVPGAGEPVVELPVHWSLDDWEQYAFLPEPRIGSVIEEPDKVERMWRAELDGMRHYGCLFNLCLHPFLTGRPSRMLVLRRLIEHARDCGDVTFARCRDVAEWARADPATPVRPLPAYEIDAAVYPH
ncbi:polysaccharide deacetylase [Nocardia neocaledoniensis NBRC 108232]|uniref:Polysaccharide deacetylase n=1 Tax=Nocardia neocaledoniensis TaxID=236511 RepID=A0A317NWH7_9NOCA|nr:polysaccharide deacetylase [Nocardia neocaledoniensis]PWV79322.1 polysaccharide deacetylase [Nocardia neocaledoniensis]GEM33523.1 polysaccharide deacetylase [Nocardia neocaledoniensis NBRC 108232]